MGQLTDGVYFIRKGEFEVSKEVSIKKTLSTIFEKNNKKIDINAG